MDNKIKVMHLISAMNDGGAQKIVLNYLRDFKNDKEIDLKLFVYGKKSQSHYNRIIANEKLNVTYLNAPKSKINIPCIRKYFNRIIAYKVWKKAIEEYQPDIVHVHVSPLLVNVLKPILQCNVSICFNTLHSNPLRFHGEKLRAIRKAYKKGGFIPICVTNEQVKIAMNYYRFHQYEVVHNGIDVEHIKELIVQKEEARSMYNIPTDAFVIFGIGRLDKIKRFDLLIDIFNNVLKKKKNALLVIAGEGKEKDNLIKKVNKLNMNSYVRFIGNQDNVVPLYCASDVVAITSKSESASLVLLEAQVCKLRCVISDGVPSESIITNRVKKMDSKASINDWCEALLNTEYKGKKVSCIEEYDVHTISKRMKDIYLKYWKDYKNEK